VKSPVRTGTRPGRPAARCRCSTRTCPLESADDELSSRTGRPTFTAAPAYDRSGWCLPAVPGSQSNDGSSFLRLR
jgi:hypothetical protein